MKITESINGLKFAMLVLGVFFTVTLAGCPTPPSTGYIVSVDDVKQLSVASKEESLIIYNIDDQNDPLSEIPIQPGDIIMSSQGVDGEGYLRKALAVQEIDGKLYVLTEMAGLADAFEEGEISIPIEFTPEALEKAGFSINGYFDMTNKTLYDNNGLTVKVTRGGIRYVPSGQFDIKWKWSAPFLNSLKTNITGMLSIDMDVRISATKTRTYSTGDLFTVPIVKVPWSAPPVVGTLELAIPIGFSGSISSGVTVKAGFDSSSKVGIGTEYSSGSWINTSDLVLHSRVHTPDCTASNSATATVYAKPQVRVKVYETVGTGLGVQPYLRGDVKVTPTPKTLSLTVGIDGFVNFNAKAFGFTAFDYTMNLTGPSYNLLKKTF